MSSVLIDSLLKLGLSRTEAAVYVGVASLGIATAREASDKAGVPTSHVYQALDGLVKKGLVELLPTEPKRYQVFPPDLSIKSMAESSTKDIKKARDTALHELTNLYGKSAASLDERHRVVMGVSNILRILGNMIGRATSEIKVLTRDPKALDSQELYGKLTDAGRSGVGISVITSDLSYVEAFPNELGEARYVDVALPGLLMIADGDEAFVTFAPLMGSGLSPSDVGLWISDRSLVTSYSEYFRHVWIEHYRSTISRMRGKRAEKY